MKITADEVLAWVERLVRPIDRRTLNHYIKWGLISPPCNARHGGKNYRVYFGWRVIIEAATTCYFLNCFGARVETVKEMREQVDTNLGRLYKEKEREFEQKLKAAILKAVDT